MVNHPDRGGDTATMQEINAEYDVALKRIINGTDDKEYKDTNKTEGYYSFWTSREEHTEVEMKVREAIEKIIHLEGIEIEIIGVWVYVTGSTKETAPVLKEAGFKANKNKETGEWKWIFMGKKSGGRGTMSMDEMREKYGTEKVKTNPYKKLKAA
jgi:hypothetical protein